MLEATLSAKPVPYSHVLVLDSRLRDFYVPLELDMFGPAGLTKARPLLMQQASVSTGVEISVSYMVKADGIIIDSFVRSNSSASSPLFCSGVERPRAIYH